MGELVTSWGPLGKALLLGITGNLLDQCEVFLFK